MCHFRQSCCCSLGTGILTMVLFNCVLRVSIVALLVLAELQTVQIVHLSIYVLMYFLVTSILLGLGVKMRLESVFILWEVIAAGNLTFGNKIRLDHRITRPS